MFNLREPIAKALAVSLRRTAPGVDAGNERVNISAVRRACPQRGRRCQPRR